MCSGFSTIHINKKLISGWLIFDNGTNPNEPMIEKNTYVSKFPNGYQVSNAERQQYILYK